MQGAAASVPGGRVVVVGGTDPSTAASRKVKLSAARSLQLGGGGASGGGNDGGTAAAAAAAAWVHHDPMPTARDGLAAVALPDADTVLAIGGATGLTSGGNIATTGAVEALSLATGRWDNRSYPPLPEPAMAPGAAVDPFSGNLVVVGGFGYAFDDFYSNHTWVLDNTDVAANANATAAKAPTRAWRRAADSPLQRSGLNCASTSKGVLCFGGGEQNPAYADAALFDGTAWRRVAPMLEARNWFAATDVSTVAAAAPAPAAAGAGAGAAAGGGGGGGGGGASGGGSREYVYAVGGYCCSLQPRCFFSPLASAERYDVAADRWERVAGLEEVNAGNMGAACRAGAGGEGGSEGGGGGCPGPHTVLSFGGGQADRAPLVLQAVNPPPVAGPSGWVPADDCAGDGGSSSSSSSSSRSSRSSNEDGDGDGCDTGTLCCKDPQAAGAGTGACYKVSNCSVIRDGR